MMLMFGSKDQMYPIFQNWDNYRAKLDGLDDESFATTIKIIQKMHNDLEEKWSIMKWDTKEEIQTMAQINILKELEFKLLGIEKENWPFRYYEGRGEGVINEYALSRINVA